VVCDVIYTTDVPKLNTQRYFEIQNTWSYRRMRIVLSSIQLFKKTAASMLRVGDLVDRRWQMRTPLKCNVIQGWITCIFRAFLPPVRLIWSYTTQISVGSELSPQGSSCFRCPLATLHLNLFCAYPIWTRAVPAALGYVIVSDADVIRD
jgi:hypothetical protein